MGGGWTSADLSLSWTGDDTTFDSDPTQGYYAANLTVTTDAPGIYSVFAAADHRRCHHAGLVCTNTTEAHFVRATNSWTFVAVTNVTPSTNVVAVGDPAITLTAQMTPVVAGQHVYWEIIQGGGTLSTNQGLTVDFKPPMSGGGVCLVKATCGSNSATATVYACAVTALAASPAVVAVGDTVLVSATHEPCIYPSVTWGWNLGVTYITSDATTLSLRIDQPGVCTVLQNVGASEVTCQVTGVGVKEIQYAVGEGAWTAWTNLVAGGGTNAGLAVGATLRVRAIPDPEDASFPAGWPVWGGAASGAGSETTVTFSAASTNADDFKLVTATCGTSSRTVPALVYRVDSISVATNHVAIGTNTLTLTAVMTPATGGEGLVSWSGVQGTNEPVAAGEGGSIGIACDLAGSFTFTAACGSSSATTNINVYAVTGVSASLNPVAAGEPVTLTTTTEPANSPLPISWNVSTNTSLVIASSLATPGYFTVTATLGTSSSSCVITNVAVGSIEYQDADLADAWLAPPSPVYTITGVAVPFRAYPIPADASWPGGKPIWSVDGVDVGTGDTYTLPGGPVAPSATNTVKIRVRCGTSYKDASVLFFKSELVSGPAIYWEGRSMSEWGVGERVYITNKISPSDLSPSVLNLSWGTNFPATANFEPSVPVAIFDDAVIPGTYEVISYWGKNYLGNTFFVELGRKGEPVFAPTSITYVAILPDVFSTNSVVTPGVTNIVGSGVWHEVNTSSAGVMLAMFVGPTNKDYSKLKFSEGEAAYSANGVLERFHKSCS